MNVQLYEGRIANAAKAMDLSRLDHKNVTRGRFEFLSVDRPEAAAFSHELDFIVWMTVWPRATAREGTEKVHGNIDIPVIRPNEMGGAAQKGQLLLTDAVHFSRSRYRYL
jgi:hypothetical protein